MHDVHHSRDGETACHALDFAPGDRQASVNAVLFTEEGDGVLGAANELDYRTTGELVAMLAARRVSALE